MVPTTEPVAGAITLIVFEISLLTYNCGPGLCAGAAVAHNASATTLEARAAITNLPPDAMSVVEDRLVSIEGLVEPPDAVPAPDSTQDGPREVRAGHVRVGEVCAGQIGAREIDLAEVRGREVGADLDRKSTRLNSSHSQISYAVFCLKKKKTTPAWA